MIKRIISIIYVIALLLMVICVPLSAIFIIVRLCEASTMSWFACCVPVLIALGVLPLFIITKVIIDVSRK